MISMRKRFLPVERISPGNCDYHPYYTHAAFHPSGRHIWYQGEREGGLRLFVRDLETGTELPLPGTEGVGAGSACLNRSGSRLYYLSGTELFVVDFPVARESAPLARLDGWEELGQPTFCETDRELYLAAKAADDWFVLAVDTESGLVRTVGRFPYHVCHLQGSPVGSTLMFCDQRGDWCVPQRIWLVEADGSGLRPLYQQKPEDWVTHESWTADASAVSFILHPIGFCLIDRDNTNLRIYTPAEGPVETLIPEEIKQLRRLAVQHDYPRPGEARDTYGVSEAYGQCASWPVLWHVSTSPAGPWAVADTHRGEIVLIDLESGRMTQIAEKQFAGGKYHPHPAFAPDGRHVYWTRSDSQGVSVVWADVAEIIESPKE